MAIEVNRQLLTPLWFLKRAAYVFPEKTAVVDGERRFTYREFKERVNRLASALKKYGIGKWDKVAYLAPNIHPFLEGHYGVPLARGVLVSINTRLKSNEILYILNHSESKILIVDSELASLIEPIYDQLETVQKIVMINQVPRETKLPAVDYEEFLQEGEPEDLPIPIEDEFEPITLNYTSGTTGFPKGVQYTHRGAYLNSLSEVIEMGLNQYSKYLWILPMFHCNGWCFTWAVTAVGATHYCFRKFEPEAALEIIEKEKITNFCGAPVVFNAMTAAKKAEGLKFNHPIRAFIAGAAPSPTIISKMERLGVEVVHVYGLTEVYGPFTVCEWHPEWDNLSAEEKAIYKARQGVPMVTTGEVRVVDAEMNDVPADGKTMGEIVMRGNGVMAGYYKAPEDTAKAFAGGWFHSGDLAVMHPNGYIEIMDRSKDIIISGGENISSVEVENVLYSHPAVYEVAVVASPDERWGEVPKAFIVLREGASVTPEELIAYCREKMAGFKVPKKIEFVDALPKTPTGKIQKFVLRNLEWKGEKKVKG
ncbi:acyl--CoA ligase family protein [Carboxydothermus hydrogenoformans]|uniref:AMP-binding enzyme family protein n=1 Tax=Carboxydothermus hydrogenoformans (strain ATCC BAA-161 / DSM 6008 / Z-2901) TaxID=246194 RepID=Q3ABN2_CARHZ|nr:acyl--CoA ligase family protein [Carboxydothermus hydrogenoformans]ABB16086.1 AMP-binding enzyme family protein [Carboxydothermus hydrogenoformans Z-2901]